MVQHYGNYGGGCQINESANLERLMMQHRDLTVERNGSEQGWHWLNQDNARHVSGWHNQGQHCLIVP